MRRVLGRIAALEGVRASREDIERVVVSSKVTRGGQLFDVVKVFDVCTYIYVYKCIDVY